MDITQTNFDKFKFLLECYNIRGEMDKQSTVATNFLSTLDLNLPMTDHFRNALLDAHLYKWGHEILIEVMTGIELAYGIEVDR